jgi:hypothetical protein
MRAEFLGTKLTRLLDGVYGAPLFTRAIKFQ